MALDSVRLNQLKLTRGHLAGTLRASPQAVEIQAAGARPDESLHLQVDPVTWMRVCCCFDCSLLCRGPSCMTGLPCMTGAALSGRIESSRPALCRVQMLHQVSAAACLPFCCSVLACSCHLACMLTQDACSPAELGRLDSSGTLQAALPLFAAEPPPRQPAGKGFGPVLSSGTASSSSTGRAAQPGSLQSVGQAVKELRLDRWGAGHDCAEVQMGVWVRDQGSRGGVGAWNLGSRSRGCAGLTMDGATEPLAWLVLVYDLCTCLYQPSLRSGWS